MRKELENRDKSAIRNVRNNVREVNVEHDKSQEYQDTLKKYMRLREGGQLSSPRPTHMVNGDVGKIERGNPANRYQEGNNLNVSAFVRDSKNRDERKEAMLYAGLTDYYSPSAFSTNDYARAFRRRKK